MIEKEFDKAPWIIRSNGDIISKKLNKPRKLFPNNAGYLMANYRKDGKVYNYYIHRLVAEAFIGEIPKGMAINHKDGNKLNNDVSNLEIVTYSENIRHADKTGLRNMPTGECNAQSKLTNEEAKNLIFESMKGATNNELADKYGLHPRYVSLIRHRKRWKNLWEEIERATTIERLKKDAS